jgi:hypothetical protein
MLTPPSQQAHVAAHTHTHTHTRVRACAHRHPHTHVHTHTHTHTCAPPHHVGVRCGVVLRCGYVWCLRVGPVQDAEERDLFRNQRLCLYWEGGKCVSCRNCRRDGSCGQDIQDLHPCVQGPRKVMQPVCPLGNTTETSFFWRCYCHFVWFVDGIFLQQIGSVGDCEDYYFFHDDVLSRAPGVLILSAMSLLPLMEGVMKLPTFLFAILGIVMNYLRIHSVMHM